MTVQEVFESIRVNDKNKIRIQLRDNKENYICETYIHALGMKPYYSCEVTDWEPFVDKEHPGYVKICANIIITELIKENHFNTFCPKHFFVPYKQLFRINKKAGMAIKKAKKAKRTKHKSESMYSAKFNQELGISSPRLKLI